MEASAAPEELLESIRTLRTKLLSQYLTGRVILLLPFKMAGITLLAIYNLLSSTALGTKTSKAWDFWVCIKNESRYLKRS